MQKRLEKYAKEYLIMGNESILQAQNIKVAIANYNKAIDLYPTYTEAYIQKGIALQRDQHEAEAHECFEKAVSLSPTLFKARFNRGKNHLLLHHYAEAAADFDCATSIKPEHSRAHELFGDALAQLGKEEEAAIQWAIAERLRQK